MMEHCDEATDIHAERKARRQNRTKDAADSSLNPSVLDSPSVIKRMLNVPSPVKALPNITCGDVNCKCHLAQNSPVSPDKSSKNIDNKSAASRRPIILPSRNTPIKDLSSLRKEQLDVQGTETILGLSVSKEATDKPVTEANGAMSSDQKDTQIMVQLAKQSLEEGPEHPFRNNESCDQGHLDKKGDVESKRKQPRKTLSLYTWKRRRRQEEQLRNEIKSYQTKFRLGMGDCQPSGTDDSLSNKHKDTVDYHKVLHSRFSNEYRHRKLSLSAKASAKRAEDPPEAHHSSPTANVKVQSESNAYPTKEAKDTDIPRQISFVRNDMGFPIVFSPQSLMTLNYKSVSDLSQANSNKGQFPNNLSMYASYGTVPQTSLDAPKEPGPIYVLPYLIVPSSAMSSIGLQHAPPQKDAGTLNNATTDGTGNCKPSETTTSVAETDMSHPKQNLSTGDESASPKTVKSDWTKLQPPCEKSPNSKPFKNEHVGLPLQMRFDFSKYPQCTTLRDKQKLKFALSLELMKAEPRSKDTAELNDKSETCSTARKTDHPRKGNISFLPAVQVKRLGADTCYTLQVVSLIKTKAPCDNLESPQALGWTPAFINRTDEGHINMIFVPQICTGLYLVEDTLLPGTSQKWRASDHQNVRLIPFAPSLEIPTDSTALALGRPESSWAACVDFLKRLPPSSPVHQAIAFVTSGKECACFSSVNGNSEDLSPKKSKLSSLVLPKCRCCQCKGRRR